MAAAGTQKFWWWVFWISACAASAWFLFDSYVYALTRDHQAGATSWNRLVWYGAHIVVATPVLLIAPLQFAPGLRASQPVLHRWLGRVFLGASLIAAPLGIWLGATIESPGGRIPISLLGASWFVFSAIAWQAARRRDYREHRRFAIRSFAMAFSFVWLRVIGEISDGLLGFIGEPAVLETTQEWLAFVVPLLIAEAWLSWWPAWRGR